MSGGRWLGTSNRGRAAGATGRAPQLREGCLSLFSVTNLTITEPLQCAEIPKAVIDTVKRLLERRGAHVGFLAIVQIGVHESVSLDALWRARFVVESMKLGRSIERLA